MFSVIQSTIFRHQKKLISRTLKMFVLQIYSQKNEYSKMKHYFITPYTSTFIRLSHLYQEFCVHCTVLMNDGGMG